MMDQANEAPYSWTYTLEPDARRRIRSLYQTRCDEEFALLVDDKPIHFITLLQMIQHIGHTVYDESHLDPREEEFLRKLEVDVRGHGDAIVRNHLIRGGIADKEHTMYMLVRNIRSKVVIEGATEPLMLFNVTDNGPTVTLRYAQPRGPSQFVFVEEAPWMYVSAVVDGHRFELDTSDGFGAFPEQLGLQAYGHRQRFVQMSSMEVQESLRNIWESRT